MLKTRLQRLAVVTFLAIVTVLWTFDYTATAFADASNPTKNFCRDSGLNDVVTTAKEHTDKAAGVTWYKSVSIPLAGGNVGIYFKNNGPGPIIFDSPSWSVKVKGDTVRIPRGQATTVPLSPAGSSTFNDLGWGGTFNEGEDIVGCTEFSNPSLTGREHGTAHLDLSFLRANKRHTVRVDVRFESQK